ncbi:MAG: RNA polymerase sigma factor [Oscillospiraceae bacterium]
MRVMEKEEYRELREMAANGDMKAFAHLYETIYREMYYTAYYSLADDTDAVEVICSTVKSTFAAIGRLHTEAAFRLHMMKTLCGKIKAKFRMYAAEGIEILYDKEHLMPNDYGVDIKQEFNRLSDTVRLITALYIGGKCTSEEISQYIGLSASAVNKKIRRVLEAFALD